MIIHIYISFCITMLSPNATSPSGAPVKQVSLKGLSPELYTALGRSRLCLFYNTDKTLSFEQFDASLRYQREAADGPILVIDGDEMNVASNVLELVKTKLRSDFQRYSHKQEVGAILSNLDTYKSIAAVAESIYENFLIPFTVILKNPPLSKLDNVLSEVTNNMGTLKMLLYFDASHTDEYARYAHACQGISRQVIHSGS